MRVLLAGASGQLGQELQRSRPEWVNLLAADSRQLDLTSDIAVRRMVLTFDPEVIINAAAYTAVDAAETDREAAFAVNEGGARRLAWAARAAGARCIHVSTDFVFDGELGRPCDVGDEPRPRSVYGQSKLAGERAVTDICDKGALVVRTAWLYSNFGNNFVTTMLGLMSSKPELGVVADQVGSPTWAAGLASALWEMAARPELSGVMHWADQGQISWYEFAAAIQAEACRRGLLDTVIPIRPLTTEQFPRPAPRPACSALDTRSSLFQLESPLQPWREALRAMLDQRRETVHA